VRSFQDYLEICFNLSWYLHISPVDVGEMSIDEINWYYARISAKLMEVGKIKE
jgi:hypothetical protein